MTRAFDKDGRLSSVTDWNSKATTFGYDADSGLGTLSYPNGTAVTSTFDNADQLTASTLTAGTTSLASLSTPRDDAGQVSGETPTGLAGGAQTYAYTALEQVKSTTTGTTTTSYGYDPANNPTTVGGATQTFDASNQLCWGVTGTAPANPACANAPTGATTYSYDTEGDRRTATTGTASTTYGYDQGGRLTSYTASGTSASYTYNGSGLRTSKTINATVTPFTWDIAQNLIYDGTTAYLYGPSGVPIEQISTTASQWYYSDRLGSTRALTDSSGAVVASYAFTPWGAVSAHTGTASTPLQYAGQYADAESGLTYLRARYYDPGTAQFLTVDPAYDSTNSRYGYATNNPLNGTDPTGLGFWSSLATGLGVAGAALAIGACVIAEPCGAAVAVAGVGIVVTDAAALTVIGALGAAGGVLTASAMHSAASAGSGGGSSGGGDSGGGSAGDSGDSGGSPANSGVAARPVSEISGSSGCEEVATQIQSRIGGQIWKANPPSGASNLGTYRGVDSYWANHEFVVKDGWAYDQWTGPEGEPLQQYKEEFDYWDVISFSPK